MELRRNRAYPTRFIAAVGLWLLLCPAAAFAQEPVLELRISGQTMSARLEAVPLQEVVQEFKRKGIWIRGEKHLPAREITLQFQDLELREGFKRILSDVNYCIVFGGEHRIDGLIVVGRTKVPQAGLRPAPSPPPPPPAVVRPAAPVPRRVIKGP